MNAVDAGFKNLVKEAEDTVPSQCTNAGLASEEHRRLSNQLFYMLTHC